MVAIPDPKKGEQLVLVTTLEIDRKQVADGMKREHATELMITRNIITVPELPMLGSGKTDYVALNRLAREKVKV